MSKDNQTLHQPIVHTLVYAVLGSLLGLAWGLIMDSGRQGFFFLPPISGLLAGLYLSWVYRFRKTSVNLIVRVGAGIAIGLILGILPGMILGTILSIPFPASFWSFFYLFGHFIGMLVVSILVSKWIVYLGTENQ